MIVAYPQPGKTRSTEVLTAFAKGCGGRVQSLPPPVLEPGGAAFYGVIGLEHLLNLARAEKREFYYGDNAHFDLCRQRYFRFSKNDLQEAFPKVAPDYDRLSKLGLSVRPWVTDGNHIVVVEQSEHFNQLSGAGKDWLPRTVKTLRLFTDRIILVRSWRRDKDKAAVTLRSDLRSAHALVTHMSAAANEALLAGVPVFVSGRCAAMPLASGVLGNIETPRRPDGREEWAARLAASQWTIDEIAAGKAWGALNG